MRFSGLLAVLVSFVFVTHAAGAVAPSFDLMVQGALDWEIQPLILALEHKKEVRIGAWTFWTGRIGKVSVVVSRTGMGPINAVTSTTLGIDRFHPKAIVNQGTAGGQLPSLHVYDIVVGEKTVDYSAFKSDHADADEGVTPARWKPMYHQIGDKQYLAFPGDPTLLDAALATPYAKGKVLKGTVGSAFQFNREIDHLTWLHKTYGSDSEDMESVYVAGTAAGMGVPFLAVRILSDNEYNHPNLEKDSGAICAQFVVQFIRRLGNSGYFRKSN